MHRISTRTGMLYFFVSLTILAALMVLHRQLGGFAPAPPVTVPGVPTMTGRSPPASEVAKPIILQPQLDQLDSYGHQIAPADLDNTTLETSPSLGSSMELSRRPLPYDEANDSLPQLEPWPR